MKVNSQVFRAYDIRGIVGTELSDELIEKLGKAIGTKLQRNNLNLNLGSINFRNFFHNLLLSLSFFLL